MILCMISDLTKYLNGKLNAIPIVKGINQGAINGDVTGKGVAIAIFSRILLSCSSLMLPLPFSLFVFSQTYSSSSFEVLPSCPLIFLLRYSSALIFPLLSLFISSPQLLLNDSLPQLPR